MHSARKILLALVAATAVAATAVVVAPAAEAATAVTVKAARTTINVHTAEKFTYTGPKKWTAYLQRKSGTKWKTVKTLGRHPHGHVSVKLNNAGRSQWRVIYKRGHKTRKSHQVTVTTVAAPVLVLKTTTGRINAGTSPRFIYSSSRVGGGVTIALQRQFGTGNTWRTVQSERAASTTTTIIAPKLPTLGRYVYRLVALESGKAIAASKSVVVYAYATVPLSLQYNGPDPQTEQVGARLYTYDTDFGGDVYPEYQSRTLFSAPGTSCRSISIDFAGDATAQNDGDTAYLQIVQTAADAVYANVATGAVGHISAALDGGPVNVNVASSDYSWASDVVGNISGSCYTVSGQR